MFTDGLTDCQDPECCGSAECSRNVLCTTVADPADVQDSPDSHQVPSTFWERIRFIVESQETQKYADVGSFDPRKVMFTNLTIRLRRILIASRSTFGLTLASLKCNGLSISQKYEAIQLKPSYNLIGQFVSWLIVESNQNWYDATQPQPSSFRHFLTEAPWRSSAAAS